MLVVGLLAMQGVQASSTSGTAGIAILGNSDVVAGPFTPGSDGRTPRLGHRHAGGLVYPGIVVLVFTLILRTPAVLGRLDGLRIPLVRLRFANATRGRPPPSIYRLAVLRL